MTVPMKQFHVEDAEAFPGPTAPIVYADSIINIVPFLRVAKFNLIRSDPDEMLPGHYRMSIAAQVTMPHEGLIMAFVAMERTVAHLVANDPELARQLEEARNAGNTPMKPQ